MPNTVLINHCKDDSHGYYNTIVVAVTQIFTKLLTAHCYFYWIIGVLPLIKKTKHHRLLG